MRHCQDELEDIWGEGEEGWGDDDDEWDGEDLDGCEGGPQEEGGWEVGPGEGGRGAFARLEGPCIAAACSNVCFCMCALGGSGAPMV